nr:MAG TPA: hypothetical protein [Caudoviricetes sp.]
MYISQQITKHIQPNFRKCLRKYPNNLRHHL